MIFIHLEIIGEEKYIYFYKKIYKNFYNLVKPLGATTVSKPNFYYIVYDMYIKKYKILIYILKIWVNFDLSLIVIHISNII